MKVLIFLLGYFLATLAQSVIVLNDINNIPICASLNNVNKTFINIWQIYEEFKTTGQIWTPVTTGACPKNNIDCTLFNPVCAVSSNNFFKTFPNRCVLETEQKTTGTVWNVVFNGICFVSQDDTYLTSPVLSKIYPTTSPVSSIYDNVLVAPPALREPIQQYAIPSYGAVPSPSAAHYNPAPQKLHSPPYPTPLLGPNNNIPVNLNPAPTPQPYASSYIPDNYNQSVEQVSVVQAPLSLYSPSSSDTSPSPVIKVCNSTPEPLLPPTYTVPSPNSENLYQVPTPVHSPSYLSPSTFAAPSPDPVPAIVDPLPVPADYSPAPAPQTYAPIVKVPTCHEPLALPSYSTFLLPPGNNSQSVTEVKAPLSLYSPPTIDTVPPHVTEVYNYPPEPLPPTTYTVPSPNSNISSSYLSPSNHNVLSPDPVATIVDPLHVPAVYNTATTPQPYAPAIKILSYDHIPSPAAGVYNPEPLHSSSYPAPPTTPGNYNQPVEQVPKIQDSLSLYSSPSIDTVYKPINDVYNTPPEPLPPSTYTVSSPISDSYYQAPEPVPSPAYLSPSNYTILSPDPVPLPVPVNYNTAPTLKPYAPANEIPSSGYNPSPATGPYNPEPLPSSIYTIPSPISDSYYQAPEPVPSPAYLSPSNYTILSPDPVPLPVPVNYNTAPTLKPYAPANEIPSSGYNPSPAPGPYNPEPLPSSIYTVPSPISDSYYQAPEPVPSPAYASTLNYTVLSPIPVPAIVDPYPVPVDYNTAPTPQPYAPAIKILSCNHIPSPAAESYNQEALHSSSYPAHPPIPANYNQPIEQVPKIQGSLSLYSSPFLDTVSKPINNVYNSPAEPLPSSTYTVPSPISDSYYQAPEPVPSPAYLSPSNYTILSPDPVPLPVPVNYNTAPTLKPYAPANEIPSSGYNPSPAPGPYNPEPLPSSIYTVPSPISDSYYQAPEPVPSPAYLSPSNYTIRSPDPVPLPVPVNYNTVPTLKPYAPANEIPSSGYNPSPAPGPYNPEPLPSSTYTVPSPISDSYYQAPEPVPSPSYLSPSNYTILSPDPVPLPVPVNYNTAPTLKPYAPANEIPSSGYNPSPSPGPYNPEPLPSSIYTVPSSISDSYYQAPEPVPSPAYVSTLNYTVLSPVPVPAIVDPYPVPVDYNTAPTPQPYDPAIKILSCNHIPSPAAESYNPEALDSSTYPAHPPIPANYNQPIEQVPKIQASLSLYSSPFLDTVSKPINNVYNSPAEPLPSSTYTVPSPISDSYYQAPEPVPSPAYLSPSNYTILSPDPVPLPVPVNYNTAPTLKPYAPANEIPSSGYNPSPAPGPYNPEPLPSSIYTVPSPISDSYYQAPEPVPSPAYLSPSNYTILSPDPVPLPVPVNYNTVPTLKPYAPANEIPSSGYNPSPAPGPYNPEPLPSSIYTVPSQISDSYYQAPEPVPSPAYLSPSNYTILSPDPVPLPVPVTYNTVPTLKPYAPANEIPSSGYNPSTAPGPYNPEPLPSSIYTVPSPISDSYYQAPEPVPSPAYVSTLNYTVLSPIPVQAIVDPYPVPVDYNTAPTHQPYAPAIKILSCNHIPSPAAESYNPEALHSSSYPAQSPTPGNYNQPVEQVPKIQASLSLYSSPFLDTVSKPINNVNNSPAEPLPSSTYTVSSPISDSYYQAPEPVPSPAYLSPSNYTILSPDPVPLPVPVNYNTAPTLKPYAPANEIPSSGYKPSPAPGPYNPEPLPSSTYTVPSPISDSNYQAPEPVPSRAYLSPSNYTLLSPDPVSLPVPVNYNTAPSLQSYAPANEIPSSGYNPSPVAEPYNPKPLPSSSYPASSPIPANYNQPVEQVPEVQASLSLYSSPSIDTVPTHVADVYNSPPEPLPPSTDLVPLPISVSYYQAPAQVPLPSYLSPSNYSVLSPDPVPAIVGPLPVPVDYSTSKPQSYAPDIEIHSCDHNPSPAPGAYNPAQEPQPPSSYPVQYNQVSASDNMHSPAPYSPALDPLALPPYSVPSSNPSDYRESFVAAPASSYSLPTYNPTSSHVLGNYNLAPQTSYSHNDSSAGTVNYNPNSAAASPVPDPYNPITEPPTTPSYPSPSLMPIYEAILSDPVPHYLPPVPESTAANNQYTVSATTTKYSSPYISNPVSNAYPQSDSDKIPYKPVQNYQQSNSIYSAPSEHPNNSYSADTPSPTQTYQQLSNTTYSPPETSNAYAEESAPDVGPCSNVKTFSSPVLDYQSIPSYSQIYKDIPIVGKNYSNKPNNNNIVKSHLVNQSDYNANPSPLYDKPKVFNEAKNEHSRHSGNNVGQTIYNGVVYQGPYYYIPKYKHINYGNFNFLPSQNLSPAPVPFAPAIPALVSAYPYVGTPFSGFSTNPFEQLLKQLQYIATKN